MPKNVALLNLIEAKRKNNSAESIQSIKDESFNVPKVNQSNEEDKDAEELITAIATGGEGEVIGSVEESKAQVESTVSSQVKAESPVKS